MDRSDKFIKLVELANTWQGEGPDTGRQMLIARFKYCNRHCKFCDTWIKMKTSIEGSYSINDINQALSKTKGLMITGGEPTMDSGLGSDNFYQTMSMISECEYQVVNVETNGCNIIEFLKKLDNTVLRSDQIVKVMYSPKTFNEEDVTKEYEKVKSVIEHPDVYLKIVADTTQLTESFIKKVAALTVSGNKSKIYLMPLGVTPEEIAKNWDYCINLADDLDLNISTRMHIMNQFT